MPDPNLIIAIQRQEIDRLNDNRVVLLATLEEVTQELNELKTSANGKPVKAPQDRRRKAPVEAANGA